MIQMARPDKRWLFRWLGFVGFAILLISLFSFSLNGRKKSASLPLAPSRDASPTSSPADGLAAPSSSLEIPKDESAHEALPTAAPSIQPLHPAASLGPQLHVVIAHHSEEPQYIKAWTNNLRTMPYMQELGIKVIIYTKQEESDTTALKEMSGAEEVIRLPNVGREGGTYLHHILRVYNDPPKYILFAQAVLKKAQQETGDHIGELKDWLDDRLRNKFSPEIGFMSLDRKHDICYCGHCTDMGRDDFYPIWPQIYAMLENQVCQELDGHLLSFNGHFIVSRKRLLARPQWIYKYLQDLVDAPQDHWIHSEPEPKWFNKKKGKSMPSNPKFGHTLERLWHVIFSCSDPGDTMHCDMAGMKAEGPGGCSCRDSP